MISLIKRYFKDISFFKGITTHFKSGRRSNVRLATIVGFNLFLIAVAIIVPQANAQDTVSGGDFSNPLEVTEFSQSGTLDLFDSNLGTLNSVTLTITGVGNTDISLTNAAGASTDAQVNTAITQLFFLLGSPDTGIDDVLGPLFGQLDLVFVNNAPPDFTGTLTIAPGVTEDSGEISDSEDFIFNITDAADVAAFEQAGGGEFVLDCDSFTQLNISSTGGNLSSSQSTEGGCSAEITYEYEPITNIQITEGPCWRTISSPVEQTYADFFASFETGGTSYGGLWTQGSGITGARASFGGPNVFTLNSDGNDWTPVSNLDATMPAGTGVLISVFDQDEYQNASSAGFPKVAEFTAVGSPANITLGTPNGTTSSGAGFSMLGNPFNTAIDFNLLFDNSTGIEEAAWVYDRNADSGSGGWVSTNDSGLGDLTNGIIAAGQGFIVQNTATPGTPAVDFQDAVKIPKTGTFFGKNKTKPDHLRIEVRGENVYNSAWVQLSNDGSLTETTSSDVVQFYPFEEDYAVLSTVKQGEMMDIGHFPYPNEQVSIPLSVETTSNKPMTLSLTDLQVGGISGPLYLHDTVTGKSIELTEGAEYTFTPNGTLSKAIVGCLTAPVGLARTPSKNKNTSPRFLISANATINGVDSDKPSAFKLDQNYPNPFNPATVISYQLPYNSEVQLEVFDMLGRQVATLVEGAVEAGNHQVNFDASNLTSGVYLYRLTASGINGANQIFTRKLTLIK